MLPADFYQVQKMMEMKVAEQLRGAETRRLIRQVAGGQSGQPVRTARRLLYHLGRTLVSMGHWLQQSHDPCCRSAGHAGK